MNYGKVRPIYHKDVAHLFDAPVVVQEKVDGSQFCFGIFDGQLRCYSRNRELDLDTPNDMFERAVAYVRSIQDRLQPGSMYFCEYLMRPRHNVLKYDRTPKNNLVLFDKLKQFPVLAWADSAELWIDAMHLDIDMIPVLDASVSITSANELNCYLNMDSYLGGCKVEGIVCKRYPPTGMIRAKYVSALFKEIKGDRCAPKTKGDGVDIIEDVAACLATDARFEKVLQHVQESGHLGGVPEDIPRLIKELGKDLGEEGMDYAVERLRAWGWKQIQKAVIKKLPAWYLAKLEQGSGFPKGCC